MFSVATSTQMRSIKARAIVTHIGTEGTGGEWMCSKDGKASMLCTHLKHAEAYLKLLGGCSDAHNDEAGLSTNVIVDVGKFLRYFCDSEICILNVIKM